MNVKLERRFNLLPPLPGRETGLAWGHRVFDIHKVKPVHGWREFIGEVGIIVLGVVIALALEYFVEVAHWHNKVAESTEAVKQSAANHVFAAAEQQMSEPCIEKQLDILEQRLLAAGPFKPVKRQIDRSTISYVVRGPSRIWADSVWNIAVAEGISTHYDPEFRQSLDLFYSQLSDMRGIAHEVDNLNAQLNVLSLPIPMSNTTIAHAAESIESLRAKEQLLSLMSRQIIDYAKIANVIPAHNLLRAAVYHQSGTLEFCIVHHFRINKFSSIDLSPKRD